MTSIDQSIPKLYTVAETADMLRVSRRTLDRWISAGVVTSFKIRGRRLVPSWEVRRLVGLSDLSA